MTTPTEDLASTRCDRCGRGGATLQGFCRTCGPTPLCPDCAQVHRDEIQDGEAR